jgi:hypothetical protein
MDGWTVATGVWFDVRRDLRGWSVRWEGPDGATVPVRSGAEVSEAVANVLAVALVAERRGVGAYVREQQLVGGVL